MALSTNQKLLKIIQRSAGNPQDVLTEEIKDLKAEIHRKDQWIQKMHGVSVSLGASGCPAEIKISN